MKERSDGFYVIVCVGLILVIGLFHSHNSGELLDTVARILFPGVYQ